MKSGSLRHPWLSLTDTLQNGYSFTEMGVVVFGATIFSNLCHPRPVLIDDPVLRSLDSVGMTS